VAAEEFQASTPEPPQEPEPRSPFSHRGVITRDGVRFEAESATGPEPIVFELRAEELIRRAGDGDVVPLLLFFVAQRVADVEKRVFQLTGLIAGLQRAAAEQRAQHSVASVMDQVAENLRRAGVNVPPGLGRR
jgi:hypothetical protein